MLFYDYGLHLQIIAKMGIPSDKYQHDWTLRLVHCSVNFIGITTKAVVGVVDDFSKHAITIQFGYLYTLGGVMGGW